MTIPTAPITRALVAESHPAFYRLHKYWARKPHNIVRAYIEHFSRPGEIVFDPFAGSGVTFLESLAAGRKAVSVDINPISSLITQATISPVDETLARKIYSEIESAIKPLAEELFTTTCDSCGAGASVNYVVWSSTSRCPSCKETVLLGRAEKERQKYHCPHCSALFSAPSRKVDGERPVEIWFSCHGCRAGKLAQKSPSDDDLERLAAFEERQGNSRLPSGNMYPSKRLLVHDGMSVESFFTKRNQHILMRILDSVNAISDVELKRLFTLIFTSAVAQASRLIPYRNALTTGGPAWTVSGFWIPALHMEMNAWQCFANRFDKVIYGKRQFAQKHESVSYIPAASFDELREGATAIIATRSSASLGNLLPSDSVDYIFTDPPYGDSVPYLEYSAFWLGWLGVTPDYEEEVVISDSPQRNKNIKDYKERLAAVFGECYRVLKPARWLSLTFHNRSMDVWDGLVSSVVKAGFEFINCTYQVPAIIPAKAQLSKAGSVTGDIIMNFRKPTGRVSSRPALPHESVRKIILAEAERIIAERGGRASSDEIVRGVIIALLINGVSNFSDYQIFTTLEERFEQRQSYWSFKPEESYLTSEYEQLTDVVKRIIHACLEEGLRDKKAVIAEVLSKLPYGRTPDISMVGELFNQELRERGGKGEATQMELLPT